jgi:hypothetical protein
MLVPPCTYNNLLLVTLFVIIINMPLVCPSNFFSMKKKKTPTSKNEFRLGMREKRRDLLGRISLSINVLIF